MNEITSIFVVLEPIRQPFIDSSRDKALLLFHQYNEIDDRIAWIALHVISASIVFFALDPSVFLYPE